MNADSPPIVVPAVEIGGTHVCAALVDLATRQVIAGSAIRKPLDPDGAATDIVAAILSCAASLPARPGARWAVAVPGPFDYDHGIALFEDVGKFEALHGVDLRTALTHRLPSPAAVVFLNDADAFLLGEWWAGAAHGHARAAGITLGSGVGSSFLAHGAIIDSGPDVPPQGRADLLTHNGQPLEQTISRRAIRSAYAHMHGSDAYTDVHDIADKARHGDQNARRVLNNAFHALGGTLAPWLASFDATVLVVGGSIAGSWDLIAEPLHDGIAVAHPHLPAQLTLAPAHHPAEAALLGAAFWAAHNGPDHVEANRQHWIANSG